MISVGYKITWYKVATTDFFPGSVEPLRVLHQRWRI